MGKQSRARGPQRISLRAFLLPSVVVACISVAASASAADLINYFLPTPIYDQLETTAWGAAGVVPREIHNGLEDPTLANWVYWDGKIIKGPDGKYHLFGSRWDQSAGHQGYYNSVAVHAVSDTPTGPYVDKGICYPDNQGGKGHNVTAIAMSDGRYAILVSDTRPGDLFIATSLDGPWVYQGRVQIDSNGHTTTRLTDNMSIMQRPDGRYMIVPLGGFVMISDSGIIGPYKVVTDNIFPQNVAGYPSATREDPVVWFSGGQYHVLVDDYHDRKAMHLTSPDAITWKYAGVAYDPTTDFVRYTDGTVNHWYKLERPGVLLENGHVTHFTFAGIDVDKALDLGNDRHGSKIIVVPFDGVKFDSETGVGGGTGGAPGTGGATAKGGTSGTGGTLATGGATAKGGASGTGGTLATGGATAKGGASGTGGTSTTSGTLATGGTPTTGGALATGGRIAQDSAPGGAVASGGLISVGGAAIASGGVNTSGGASTASATTSFGGAVGSGGVVSSGADGTAPSADSSGGCSCKISKSSRGFAGGVELLIAAGCLLFGRRRKSDIATPRCDRGCANVTLDRSFLSRRHVAKRRNPTRP